MTLTYMQIDWVSHFTQSNRLILIILTGAHILWTLFMARTHLLQVTSPCICLSAYSSFLADNKKCKLCATSVFSFSFFFEFIFFHCTTWKPSYTYMYTQFFLSLLCCEHFLFFCFACNFLPQIFRRLIYTNMETHYCNTLACQFLCLLQDTLYTENHKDYHQKTVINSVKTQDVKSTYKNQLHSYTVWTNYPKKKLRNQSY